MLLEAAAPAPDPQLSTLELNVSFDLAPVFIFARAQRVSLLPLNTNVGALYEGSFRVEGPAASLNYINTSGVDITVSFQFWGKVL